MARLYWKLKVDGKWGWWPHKNYPDIEKQCECRFCRLQPEGDSQ